MNNTKDRSQNTVGYTEGMQRADKIERVYDLLERDYSLVNLCFDAIDDDGVLGILAWKIMSDREDDKEGRIRDLYKDKFKSFSEWLVDVENNSYTIHYKSKFGVLE